MVVHELIEENVDPATPEDFEKWRKKKARDEMISREVREMEEVGKIGVIDRFNYEVKRRHELALQDYFDGMVEKFTEQYSN